MHSRPWRSIPLLVLAAVAAVAPACSSGKNKQPPVLINGTPQPGAIVSRAPLIVFQFDRAMDPAFISTTYFSFNLSGTNTSITNYSVENVPELNEVRIIPGILLTPGQAYDVFANGSVQSTAGIAMGSASGITVTCEPASAVITGITFGAPAAATGTNPGEITLDWHLQPAQETIGVGAPPVATVVPVTYYDIYLSTVLGGEDLIAAPFQTVTSTTGVTIVAPLHGTSYYIKVMPRDSEGNVLEVQLPEAAASSAP